AGQGAGQRVRRRLLRRGPRRALRAGPGGRRRRHPPGGSVVTAVRVGTRASVLATTQSQLVADRIAERLGREVELVTISTEGDRSQAAGTAIAGTSSTGIFVNALRDALL